MNNITSILVVLISITSLKGFAQENNNYNIIYTAVPFLSIPGDARAAGMGDIGVATTPDVYAQQWNPAKYAFAVQQQGIGVSYTPYLRKLTDDINVGQLNYYNRINERSAFSGSIRYFNLGQITGRQTPEETGLILKPNQFSADLSYALQLSKNFAMSVTGRYIRSDLKLQTSFDDAAAVNSFAADLSGYFESDLVAYGNLIGQWRGGFNISNIGPKITYSDAKRKDYIPTNMRLGGGFDFILDAQNTIGVYTEFNKLLVPTPNDTGEDKNVLEGIFSSFGDAPGGMREELKEITWAVGAEYRYLDKFSFRTGYFHESPDKGFRQYLTLGAGFRYELAEINLSYLFSTSPAATNPLEGGLRFSLSFNFGRIYQ